MSYNIISKKKLDFVNLQAYRASDSKAFPVLCFPNFYAACGILSDIEKYTQETGEQVCPIQQILCNFNTLKRIQHFIKNNWATFNVDIKGDNKVVWTKGSRAQHRKAKKLSDVVESAVQFDFANYCPGLDDELEDDILIFTDGKEIDDNIIDAEFTEITPVEN